MARIDMQQRQQQLVDATLRVITEEGVAAASLRAIANAAGTPLASVHYAFASRAALLQAALESVIEHSKTAAVTDFDLQGMSTHEILRRHVEIYVQRIRESRDEQLGIMELTLASLRDPSLQHIAGSLYTAFYQAAEQVLVHLGERVGRPWSQSHQRMARFLVMVSDGLTLAYLATEDDTVMDDLMHTTTVALMSLLEGEETP